MFINPEYYRQVAMMCEADRLRKEIELKNSINNNPMYGNVNQQRNYNYFMEREPIGTNWGAVCAWIIGTIFTVSVICYILFFA